MNFRNETEILLDMVAKAEENNLITTNENLITDLREGKQTENQFILLLSAVANIMAQLEAENNEIYNNLNLNTATGEALDNIGLIVNVARHTAQPAMVEITINLPVVQDEVIIIPPGTEINLYGTMTDYGTYVTSELIEIPAGVESVTAIGECTEYGTRRALPAQSVTGIKGVNTVTATNTNPGTSGKEIEEDDEYRERIREWPNVNSKSTRACIEDYLDHYRGIDSYKLIPLYDGAGTLKIIAETLPSLTNLISTQVYYNCMLFTDVQPLVVTPDTESLGDIKLNVTLGTSNTSQAELEIILKNLTTSYINGGLTRDGSTLKGLGISETFNPALLINFLVEEVGEIKNIYITKRVNNTDTPLTEPVPVGETSLLTVGLVEVQWV